MDNLSSNDYTSNNYLLCCLNPSANESNETELQDKKLLEKSSPNFSQWLSTLLTNESSEDELQDRDLLEKSSLGVMEVVLEYARLASLPYFSAEEEEQFQMVLDAAIDNEILSFWLAEVDHILGHHLGLLNEDDRESYRDQQALLREYLGMIDLSKPRLRSTEDFVYSGNQDSDD